MESNPPASSWLYLEPPLVTTSHTGGPTSGHSHCPPSTGEGAGSRKSSDPGLSVRAASERAGCCFWGFAKSSWRILIPAEGPSAWTLSRQEAICWGWTQRQEDG